MLQSAPSFSIYTSEDGFDGEHEREDLERSVTIGERIGEVGSGEFSFRKKGMGLIVESGEEEGEGEGEEGLNGFQDLGIGGEVEPVSPPMYLATGTGIEGDTFGGGGDVEEYFKRMVGEDPSNALFLRNYAQLLQSKGDLPGAEDYFFRATLADPKDGEICSLYAKLVWELHHDQDRALSYFEQAALAAPEDSHVLAAYASFLWEIEEEDEVDKGLAGIDVDSGKGGNLEDYYKRMVEKDPCNPLFLRNYAQFLSQSKGDLQGAEEYYSRAILADPADGEMISQYATLVWELHRDHDKTLSYFERAVQATPGDSHVLAAYAKFLWETDDNDKEEDSAGQ